MAFAGRHIPEGDEEGRITTMGRIALDRITEINEEIGQFAFRFIAAEAEVGKAEFGG